MANRKWIEVPIKEGVFTRQAHCDIPEGLYERELGREGFFGPVTHMLHAHPPTGWSDWQGDLKPHAFRVFDIKTSTSMPWNDAPLLYNTSIALRFWNLDASMKELVRNSDGDELCFVHEGEGDLFCDYGHLSFSKGDYIVIPRGTLWRLETQVPCRFLLIESRGSVFQLPDKGVLGPQAIFDTAVLEYPHINRAFEAQKSEEVWSVRVKRCDKINCVTYPYNPLDAVGWHGNNTVFRLNCRDIRPITSHRYHLPPSVHTTFLAPSFVVCTFCPRPIESDPGALKVPFFHNNDDFDEVIFYHEGNFFSRDHIEKGMITFHPCGFTHGPHPKALHKSLTNPAEFTDEVAVMIDTRQPLEIGKAMLDVEDMEYVNSWKSPNQ